MGEPETPMEKEEINCLRIENLKYEFLEMTLDTLENDEEEANETKEEAIEEELEERSSVWTAEEIDEILKGMTTDP